MNNTTSSPVTGNQMVFSDKKDVQQQLPDLDNSPTFSAISYCL
jgi:hypothetical protein